jgi:hypothetical protein
VTKAEASKILRAWIGDVAHHRNCASRFKEQKPCDCHAGPRLRALEALNVLTKGKERS